MLEILEPRDLTFRNTVTGTKMKITQKHLSFLNNPTYLNEHIEWSKGRFDDMIENIIETLELTEQNDKDTISNFFNGFIPNS
jgi:hypothetical protein